MPYAPHPLNGEYTVKGHILTVEVAPCCWMYPGYPLQVGYKTADGRSSGHVRDKAYSEKTATKANVQTMLESHLTPEPCDKCGNPHLYNDDDTGREKHPGVRSHTCEVCFMAKLNAEFAEENKKEKAKIAQHDKKMKAKGFTHKVAAWIHPERGDDRQVDIYTQGEPSTARIQAELRKLKSRILTDYTILTL